MNILAGKTGVRMGPFVKGLLVVSLAGFAVPSGASASSIFSNFGPGSSYDLNDANPVGNDFAGDNAAEADSFIPTSNQQFESLGVALSCIVNCSSGQNFTISLDADLGGSPGAGIETFTFTGVTLGTLGSDNSLIIANSILQPTLLAGITYWVEISSTTNYALAWNWNSTGDTSSQASSTDGGATWLAPSGQTPSALEVDGPSPVLSAEPAPGVMLGLGIIAICISMLRRSPRNASQSSRRP